MSRIQIQTCITFEFSEPIQSFQYFHVIISFFSCFCRVLYFPICTVAIASEKVMGLQKIFSATTAIVGLFISVDYGLCDEFRCYGNDMSDTVAKSQNVGWQGNAFWTLVYVTGITLWTLHLSLLEGNLVLSSVSIGEEVDIELL